jgi:hypothetical protein
MVAIMTDTGGWPDKGRNTTRSSTNVIQVGAEHHEFAHGKIHHPGAFVDQYETESDQGRDAAGEQPQQAVFEEFAHACSAVAAPR